MSVIEANISIDVPDNTNPEKFIELIRQTISKLNSKDTYVTVNEIDNPISLSPTIFKKIKE